MKILFDINSLQVDAHMKWGVRLITFFDLLKEMNFEFAIDEISNNSLEDCSVLIILTRTKKKPFEKEQEIVYQFVKEGGSLLLMSNHAPHHIEDSKLAKKFGALFEGTCFQTLGRCTSISGNFLKNHPVITGEKGEQEINCLVTNTTCSINYNTGEVIASLSDKMKDTKLSQSPKDKIFALSLDGKKGEMANIKGRIIMVADSGFIGTKCSTIPGFGLIEEGDNRLFLKRVIRWLAA